VVGIITPLLVIAYYMSVWRVYLAPLDPVPGFIVGPPGATYIYYGWFVAGIIGLNLSLYALAGVEAAMLMHPAWDVGDAMSLMMHADATWSGPDGWIKTVKRLLRMRKSPEATTWPSNLWFVLAFPSIIAFLAWPLSGLSFEMTSGFIHRGATFGTAPNVTGFSYANFNGRFGQDLIDGAGATWRYATDASVPGKGIIYTEPGVQRFSQPYLPKDDGVPMIFLTAQADNPIHGNSWGLALQYNCSIVKDLSEFTLVAYNHTLNTTQPGPRLHSQNPDVAIQMVNQSYAGNMYAVAEFAYRRWPSFSAYEQFMKDDPDYFIKTTSCYYNQVPNFGDYPGLDDENDVLEMVLWQSLLKALYVDPVPDYNTTMDYNITELYGAYTWAVNSDFSLPLSAIGVRCTSSSNVGTADVDGTHSTYTNFVRTDTPIKKQSLRCAQRFDAAAVSQMLAPWAGTFRDSNLVSALFTSSAGPGPYYASYNLTDSPIDAGTGTLLQLSFLQASGLRYSLLRAYAAYAVQLMYNGGQGSNTVDGGHTSFRNPNPNVTEFLPGTVLTPGIVPAEVSATLFLIWSVAVLLLCAVYGFRRRWSATLDGYSLFRFGADVSEAGKTRIAAFSNTLEVDECKALLGLPGFVGDKRPQAWIGQIALVDGISALKSKRYN
jgi:hypothetical protein